MLRPGRGGNLPAYMAAPSPYSNGSQHSHSSHSDYSQQYNDNGYSNGNGSNGNGSHSNGAHSNGHQSYGGFQGIGSGADFKDKPFKKSSAMPSSVKNPAVWTGLFSVIFFIATLRYRSNVNYLLDKFGCSDVQDAVDTFHRMQVKKMEVERILRNKEAGIKADLRKHQEVEKNMQALQKEFDDLSLKYDRTTKNVHASQRMMTRDDAWREQVTILQKAVSMEAHRVVLERYGPGPHHVEIYVWLPEEGKEEAFTIEMAPIDLVPHAVLHFLEQVEHGLWDSAWFYLNGPHVMQAGPQADEADEGYEDHEDDRDFALKRFRELELEHMIFPEYSHQYPHKQWTLGYTGRPGGPDFYLNKVDNQKQHGPGGQHHHDLEEFADPCFAKVIKGFDVLNKVFATPTVSGDSEWEHFFEDPVHITGAMLLDPKPVEEKREHHVHTKDDEAKHKHKRQKPNIEHQVDA